MSTITKASIYELQGYKEEALEIYKNILRNDPYHKEAKAGVKRIIGMRKRFENPNREMIAFFDKLSCELERKEFERWLVKIWN